MQENKIEDSNTNSQFNPFIHGTNSFILPLLEHTEMQILSPIEMIRKYNVAPLGGEIGNSLDRPQYNGDTSFARLQAKQYIEFENDRRFQYTLDDVIKDYTHFKLTKMIDDGPIFYDWEQFEKYAFSDINYLMLQIVQKKQLGQKVFWKDPEHLDELFQKIEATIQVYWLALIIGKYIHPDFQLIESFGRNKVNLINFIGYENTLDLLCKKIIDQQLNIELIYQNPTPENLVLIEDLLALPPRTVPELQHGHGYVEVETRIFTQKTAEYKSEDKSSKAGSMFKQFSVNQSYGIDEWLRQYAHGNVDSNFYSIVEPHMKGLIYALSQKKEMLKQLLFDEVKCPIIDINSEFIINPLPLVLIFESAGDTPYEDMENGEFRISVPLTIGKDITMIATDTDENRERLVSFFLKNNIDNVEIVLFDQLQNAKKTGLKPSELPEQIKASSVPQGFLRQMERDSIHALVAKKQNQSNALELTHLEDPAIRL